MKLTLVFESKVKTCPSIFQAEENHPAEAIQRDLVLVHVGAVVTLGADDIYYSRPGPPAPSSTHTLADKCKLQVVSC